MNKATKDIHHEAASHTAVCASDAPEQHASDLQGFEPSMASDGEQSSPMPHPDGLFGIEDIPAPPRPLEPLSLEKWILDEDYEPVAEEQQMTSSFVKPGRSTWFKTLPKKHWRVGLFYKTSGLGADSLYLVSPEMGRKMEDVIKKMRIIPWYTVDGAIKFWLVPMPAPGATPMAWHTSALKIAEDATSSWHRLVSDTVNGYYKSAKAETERPDPKLPAMDDVWKLLASTASACGIETEDHPAFVEYKMR